MIGAIGRAIYWTIGGIQAVLELVGATHRMVKEARKGTLRSVVKK